MYDDPRREAEEMTDRQYEREGLYYPDRHDPEYLDRLYDNIQSVHDERNWP